MSSTIAVNWSTQSR